MRRRVQCAFLQETGSKGNKSRNIGQGYRLIYTGSPSGKAGVAVVLSEELRNGLWMVNGRMQTNFRAEVEIQNCRLIPKLLRKGEGIINKETWWWNDEVQELIREKKTAFKEWQQSNSPENSLEYIAAKRASKRAVTTEDATDCAKWRSLTRKADPG
nr:uncharacterized protein LOC116772505 [Danaus plexippus plexippus]